MATQHETLLDLLLERAAPASASAGSPAFSFHENGEDLSGLLTFGELDRRARDIASHLQEIARPGDRILLVMPPGLDYIVSFFACVYAGVIAVPAVPPANARTYPRLKLICRDAAARAALTLADIAERLEGYDQLAQADDAGGAMRWIAADRIDGGAEAWRRPALRPEDIAFLQYTSGSTGAPKGVMVSHGNIMANTRLIHAAFNIAPSEVVVSWLPPHHDMGLIGKILYPVFAGCHAVHMSPSAFLKRPHRWLGLIARYRAAITGGPNFAYELCTRKITAAQKEGLDLGSLRFALNGAEAIRVETLDNFAAAFADCGLRPEAITPVYGLAESTLLVTANRGAGRTPLDLPTVFSKSGLAQDLASAADGASDGQALVSLGCVPDGTHQVVIAAPDAAAPVAPGQVGEICITGPSVAQGYWQKPELSASVFVDGLGAHAGRFLRTGDLGFLHEGALFFAGRIKEMMVFGGRNIYPQDVEAAIEKLDPAFRANGCAVFSVDEGADAQLVIVQEVETRQQPGLDGLYGRLAAELGEQFEIVNIGAIYLVKPGTIPRTSSGKLQRLRCKSLHAAGELVSQWELPVPGRAAPAAAAGEQTAHFEEQLLQIWRELLDIDALSRDDNFFAMGGHSLLATQAVSRIGAAFGLELPLRALFEAPTVALLAQHLASGTAADAAVPPIAPRARSEPLPLSFAQQRLWFLDQLQPGSAFYNIAGALRLSGTLDRDALSRALDEIVRRHEVLRTTFAEADGSPVQLIAPPAPLPLPLVDVSSAADPAQAVRDQMQAAADQPFDLGRGPLIRAGLLRVAEDEHVLLLTLHHIVTDGWSMGVMGTEIATLYGAYAAQLPSPLPELAIQYADYAHWQREWLSGEVLDRQLGYWTARLQGAPSLLTLPTDRPRPAVQSFRGASLPFRVDAQTTAALSALGQRAQSTLFMTLMAAFQVLLARYAGQDDISVGTPIANRNRAGVEPLIGCFINTLVMRAQVRPQESFLDLLEQVRATSLGAYAHQDIPIEQLVDALQPERHLGHTPLFQVMLVLQNTPQGGISLPGLTATPLAAAGITAKFDLLLELTQTDGVLDGHFEYSTDLFDAATIERMGGHFARLLEAVAARPDCRIGELPMLGEGERRQLLAGWNDTAAGFPADGTLPQRFERQAALTPWAVAIVFGEQVLTYGELNARANRLAHRLRSLSVGPDRLVALCAERSPDMVAGLLAVLKAGGAYVPLDPAHPRERLAYMLDDARPAVLLTERQLGAALAAPALPCVYLEDGCDGFADTDPAPLAGQGHLAYVIYTSGSTGKPKGVMVQHGSLSNFLHAMSRHPGIQAGERLLATTTLAFDIAGLELYLPLLHGAQLFLLPNGAAADPALLERAIDRHGITMMQATPATWRMLFAHGWQGNARLTALCGGEALPRELSARLQQSTRQAWNLYGPTETTIWSTCQALGTNAVPAAAESIGTPIANTQIYLLDPELQPVPLGVAGELHIAGAGLARGYLGRPELTAEKFVPNPFSAEPGERMYKSGDLARWLPNGTIEYLGRIDHQVKIRGFRVELGEIEAALAALPGVRQGLVLAREDRPGDQRLVAYLVADDADAVDLATIRSALLRSLPEYMVPSHAVVLDAMPLTPNGKIDRKALPAPDMTRSEDGYVAPHTAMETTLAEIFAEVLSLDKIGIYDDFFARGGHSLLATRAASRIRAVCGRDLPLRTLFEAPTVASLAERLGAGAASGAVAQPIPAVDRNRDLPLSFAQQRLWFLDRLQPDSALYNLPGSLRLAGTLDRDALSRALDEIVRRHEVLRTTFVQVDDSPVQRIAPPAALPLPLIDLSNAPDPAQAVREELQAAAAAPFDLERGPLVRARLLRAATDEHVLLVTLHHIVTDGWSNGVIVKEIAALYAAYVAGQPSPLPDLAIQYADYAHWQRQWLAGEVLAKQLDYWTGQLQGAPSLLTLPTDRPRPAVQSFRGASLPFSVDAQTTAALSALGQRAQSTLFMTLMAAFQVLLARYAGQDDVSVGTPIANRNRAEIEPLVGCFVNTLVMRARVRPQARFLDLLEQVRTTALGAYAHQDIPFEQLVDALQPERNLSHTPLFQAMLALQNTPQQQIALPGLTAELLATENGTAKFDLLLDLSEGGDGLAGRLEYNTDLFDAATMERMAEHFTRLLAAIAADPACRIGELPMLSEAEHRQLLAWNDTDAPFDSDGTLHQRFVAQAALTPDAIALVFEDQQLGYAELNARANRLAHRLRASGVGPESLVGLCAERSIELVVGLLAILKAGGAYLPLDPAYPAQRLATILDDAQPVAVLAQRHLLDDLPAYGLPSVCLEDGGEGQPDTNPAPLASPANLASVIYTSDDTGKTKGVAIAHAGTANCLDWMQQACGLTAADRVLQMAPNSFDVPVWECFWPLREGATLVMAKPGGPQDPQYLAALVASQRITTLHFVPAMLDYFLRVLPNGWKSALRQIICSGEALPFELQQRFLARFPQEVALHNLYGPTEASAGATHHLCRDGAHVGTVPVGRPIANTQIHILDASMNPVPVGVAGELYIGGIGLARSYLKRPALSAEKFLPNPFSAEPGARMYRSGDLARWLPGGSIEYLGRIDGQLNIHGLRVEPGEIEAAAARSQAGYVAPRNATETMLAEIWAEVLSLEQIGIHDNFFDLGGQSLQATRAVSRIRKAFGQELPLRALFESQTVAELAPSLAAEPAAAQPDGITAVGRDQPLPLSYSQQRLWFLDQLQPNSAFYNIPGALRLSGALDQEALSRTLDEIVRRHEILRTTFVQVDGSPVQHIAPPGRLPLPLIDVSSAADPAQAVHEELQAAAATPFDLAKGPLVRARLLRVAPEEHVLLLTMHHIVTDGWSNGVMIKEIAALYGAFVAGQGSPLPELAIQYADFAHWQREWLSGEVLAKQLDYWAGQLGGAPSLLTLPTDRPRPAVQSFRGASLPFSVDARTTAALAAIGQDTQSTLFMTLMAAFQVLLSRYAGQDDVSVGTPIANRNRAEIEPLIGCFINTLVMRAQVRPQERFLDLVEQVRATALGAYAHQDIPFEQLVDALQPERRLSHAPLFQVMLALQNTPQQRIALPGLTAELLAAENDTAKFDLLLDLSESADGLSGRLEYNTDLFDASTVERMAGHFARLLEAVAADPARRIGELPMLSEAEHRQLLAWDDSAKVFEVTDMLHRRFDTRASHAYVLDETMRLLPVGVIGKLHLAGAGLPADFLSLDGLSPQHFAASPFRAGGDERLFDTGQLARRLPDGSLELHGQRDQHALVHGVRISLAQATAALQALPQVQQAVVLVHDALPVNRRLVAHVVAAPGLTLSAGDWPALRAALQATLSEYMLPQHIVLHEALPLTAAGSIDREALAALAAADTELPFLAPASATELALAEMWRELLMVDQIGVHDNFFALGGNSLSVVVLSNLVEQQFGLQLPIDVFFNAQTLLQISRHIDEQLALDGAQRDGDALSDDYATLTI